MLAIVTAGLVVVATVLVVAPIMPTPATTTKISSDLTGMKRKQHFIKFLLKYKVITLTRDGIKRLCLRLRFDSDCQE